MQTYNLLDFLIDRSCLCRGGEHVDDSPETCGGQLLHAMKLFSDRPAYSDNIDNYTLWQWPFHVEGAV